MNILFKIAAVLLVVTRNAASEDVPNAKAKLSTILGKLTERDAIEGSAELADNEVYAVRHSAETSKRDVLDIELLKQMAKHIHWEAEGAALQKHPGLVAVSEEGQSWRLSTTRSKTDYSHSPVTNVDSIGLYILQDIAPTVIEDTLYNTTVAIYREYNTTAAVNAYNATDPLLPPYNTTVVFGGEYNGTACNTTEDIDAYKATDPLLPPYNTTVAFDHDPTVAIVIVKPKCVVDWWYDLYLVEFGASRANDVIYDLQTIDRFNLHKTTTADEKGYMVRPKVASTLDSHKVIDRLLRREALEPNSITKDASPFALLVMQHNMAESVLHVKLFEACERDVPSHSLRIVEGTPSEYFTYAVREFIQLKAVGYIVADVLSPQRSVYKVDANAQKLLHSFHGTDSNIFTGLEVVPLLTMYDEKLPFDEYSVHVVSWSTDVDGSIRHIYLDNLSVTGRLLYVDLYALQTEHERRTLMVPVSSPIGVYISNALYSGTISASPTLPSMFFGEALLIAPTAHSEIGVVHAVDFFTAPTEAYSAVVYPHEATVVPTESNVPVAPVSANRLRTAKR